MRLIKHGFHRRVYWGEELTFQRVVLLQTGCEGQFQSGRLSKCCEARAKRELRSRESKRKQREAKAGSRDGSEAGRNERLWWREEEKEVGRKERGDFIPPGGLCARW